MQRSVDISASVVLDAGIRSAEAGSDHMIGYVQVSVPRELTWLRLVQLREVFLVNNTRARKEHH